MDDRLNLYYENQLRGWVAYGLREDTVPRMLPDLMQIETTSSCNLRCVFCPYPKMTRRKEFMRVEKFRQFIESQCGHIKTAGLHHFGEPFMDPNLSDFISICNEKNIETTVSTNGSFMSPEKAKVVIDAGLSRIIFSLDGATKETYEKLRVRGKFKEVVANTQIFLAQKVQFSRGPYVQIQFISTPENSMEWPMFKEFWEKHAGVDQVVLRDERTHAGQVVRRNDYVSRSGQRMPCRYLWESVVVLVDGRISLCCKDFDGKEILGNVFEGDKLESIWNGERMREIRQAHIKGEFDKVELCKNCTEWHGHGAMSELESIKSFSEYRLMKKAARGQAMYKREYE